VDGRGLLDFAVVVGWFGKSTTDSLAADAISECHDYQPRQFVVPHGWFPVVGATSAVVACCGHCDTSLIYIRRLNDLHPFVAIWIE
jgi:hypothetical protein